MEKKMSICNKIIRIQFLCIITCIAIVNNAFSQDDIWKRFTTYYSISNYQNIHAAYTHIIPDVRFPSEKIVRDYDLKISCGKFILTEKCIQKDGVFTNYSSWNGKLYVKHGTLDGEVTSKRSQKAYLLDYESKKKSPDTLFFRFLPFIREDANYNNFTNKYYPNKKLVLSYKDVSVMGFYFIDIDNFIYLKMENYDEKQNIIQLKTLRDWKKFGDISLPTNVISEEYFEGGRREEFKLKNFEYNQSFEHEDFILPIPYEENTVIHDMHNNITCSVTTLDRDAINKKEYYNAIFRKAMGLRKKDENKLVNVSLNTKGNDLRLEAVGQNTSITVFKGGSQEAINKLNSGKSRWLGHFPVFMLALVALGICFKIIIKKNTSSL
jgi:hypothetical protein